MQYRFWYFIVASHKKVLNEFTFPHSITSMEVGIEDQCVVSEIEEHLGQVHQRPQKRLHVYGGPAYCAGYGVIGKYRALPNRPLPPEIRAFNAYMSSLSIAVEHSFSKISALVTHPRGLQIGQSLVGAHYMIAVLLINIHTYMSSRKPNFDSIYMSLDEYLQLRLAVQ